MSLEDDKQIVWDGVRRLSDYVNTEMADIDVSLLVSVYGTCFTCHVAAVLAGRADEDFEAWIEKALEHIREELWRRRRNTRETAN